jgi:hypothetical protein
MVGVALLSGLGATLEMTMAFARYQLPPDQALGMNLPFQSLATLDEQQALDNVPDAA